MEGNKCVRLHKRTLKHFQTTNDVEFLLRAFKIFLIKMQFLFYFYTRTSDFETPQHNFFRHFLK